MIIWGTRGVTTNKASGKFRCPTCRSERTYLQKRLRRFFTLYFIPLVPMDLVAEYVECSGCRGQFRMDVLTLDPNAHERAVAEGLSAAAAACMIRAAAEAGVSDGEALAALRQDLSQTAGVELTHEELRSRLALRPTAQDLVRPIADAINEQGKELVFRAALAGASAAGDVGPAASKFLNDLATAMRMSPAHVRGILSETHGPS